jgi:hypothetical protein
LRPRREPMPWTRCGASIGETRLVWVRRLEKRGATVSEDAPIIDPPIDRDEVFARLRFSLDDPRRRAAGQGLSQHDQSERRHQIQSCQVRVTESLMPEIHRVVREACDRLMIETPPPVFMAASPSANAHCVVDGGEPVLILESGLFSLLEADEIAAVVGHELGHWGLRHPPPIHEHESNVVLALEREAARAAEISADRVALAAAPDFRTALRAEVKLACGLSAKHLRLDDLDAFIEQLDTGRIEADRKWEAFSTHPELQFRFWAQHRFAATDRFRSVRSQAGGEPWQAVEEEIEERFLALGGGLAFRWTVDHLHEGLAWLGTLLVCEDEVVSDREREQLVQLVGAVWAEDATAFAGRHGLEMVKRRAAETLNPLRHAPRRTHDRLTRAMREFASAIEAEDRLDEVMGLAREILGGR